MFGRRQLGYLVMLARGSGSGGEGGPSAGVATFKGRDGDVVPAANDYAASQVSNDSSVSGANVKLALNALLTSLGSLSSTVGALVTGVSSFNARGGAVTPAANDYAASQVSNDSGVSGLNVKAALDALASTIGDFVSGVSSFNGREGAVVPESDDYAASEVTNDSGIYGSTVKLALETLGSAIVGVASDLASLVTGVSSFNARGGAVTPAANDYAASQVSNDSSVSGANVKLALQTLAGLLLSLGSATPLQLGTATAGNGSTAAPINHVHPSAFANAGSENLSFDLLPTAQAQGALNTGNSVTSSVTLGAGRRYLLQAEAWVEDASGNVLFFRSLSVRAHRKATGDAILILQSPEEDPYSTVAMTFVASVSVGDIVFTLANASGTNGVYNLFVGTEACDKP